MRTMIGKAAKITAAIAMVAALGAGPAYAASASKTGADSWTGSGKVYSKDTKADSQFVSAPWLKSNGSDGSVVNKSGYNATVSRDVSSVTHVKACVSRTVGPMSCTGWNENQ